MVLPGAGIAMGAGLDWVLGDPFTTWHPVALFGRAASRLEHVCYQPRRLAGVGFLLAATVPPVVLTHTLARRFPEVTLAAVLFAALGGTTLERIGMKMATRLEAGDVEGARQLIPWLCSRDPQVLDLDDIARATVESLAENTSDATVASLFWAITGPEAVVLHRCVNTLDAMVGYRNGRYEHFGWAAAKFDDVLAWIPARYTTLLHIALGRVAPGALPQLRKQAKAHPSPNAGIVESSAAWALGVRLGGKTQYSYGVEYRPVLGAECSNSPQVETVRRIVRLERRVRLAATGMAFVARSMLWRKRNKL